MTHTQWMWRSLRNKLKSARTLLWPAVVIAAILVVTYFFYGTPLSVRAQQLTQQKKASTSAATSRTPANSPASLAQKLKPLSALKGEDGEGHEFGEGPDFIRLRAQWFFNHRAFPLAFIPQAAPH